MEFRRGEVTCPRKPSSWGLKPKLRCCSPGCSLSYRRAPLTGPTCLQPPALPAAYSVTPGRHFPTPAPVLLHLGTIIGCFIPLTIGVRIKDLKHRHGNAINCQSVHPRFQWYLLDKFTEHDHLFSHDLTIYINLYQLVSIIYSQILTFTR